MTRDGYYPDPFTFGTFHRLWEAGEWWPTTRPPGGPGVPDGHERRFDPADGLPDPEDIPGYVDDEDLDWDPTELERLGPEAPISSPEQRRAILHMLKQGKYAKPFDKGRFSFFSIMGTEDWDDYASLVVRMVQTDTLLDIHRLMETMSVEQRQTNALLERLIAITEAATE